MTLLDDQHLDSPLSTAMRDGSKVEHEAAEGSVFMTELLAGRVAEAGYAAYLLRLRVVYDALESAGRAHHHDPLVGAVHDQDLERLAALDADLDHWAPGGDRSVDSPAADRYADRIRTAAAEWGGLYVAHHYTRYLGDLSGGQAIGRILDRDFDLGGRGIAFYAFASIPKPKPYKDAYRARLDALGTTPAEKARIVSEVQEAFRLNRALFAELGERLPEYAR
ncbi:MAG TPA: biliverdin-producing heme oxygenase [Nocardioides sp.]|uniref:biliverdin-producing heme oxygenase n=1 Tax=uncultured Nocardioides sp. TaxID=198441 RepID=UPI002621BB2B|nr:biliverdin-producing heme oxygenase [uncultured Nocardioides sp.]HRI95819.1 biliverdin-producing heme oxygenase [Nocardioides sp.]HRK45962.1 biliverdin-producing heme oxygenase [Nocardioides sp.]